MRCLVSLSWGSSRADVRRDIRDVVRSISPAEVTWAMFTKVGVLSIVGMCSRVGVCSSESLSSFSLVLDMMDGKSSGAEETRSHGGEMSTIPSIYSPVCGVSTSSREHAVHGILFPCILAQRAATITMTVECIRR